MRRTLLAAITMLTAAITGTTQLKAQSFTEIESGLVDFAQANTSSSYYTYSTNLLIPAGKKLDMRTARYTYITSRLKGAGTFNLYGGGERTYISTGTNSGFPDWSLFTGETHVYPYKEKANAGFYGLVLAKHKTFGADEANPTLANRLFEGRKLVIHDGATLASESGQLGFRIGELQLEKGSRLMGYYKKGAKHKSYFMVGGSNTDAVLAGEIVPADKSDVPELGIIKEGKGTYRITGNDNLISGSIRVKEGRVLVNNDAAEAEQKKLSGGTGAMTSANDMVAHVFEKGIIGGTGNIGGNVNVYGALQPGDDGLGTLRIQNFAKPSTKTSLTLHPAARLQMEIRSTEASDLLIVKNDIIFNNVREDFSTDDDAKPVVEILLTDDADIHVGDRFELVRAAGKSSNTGAAWTFALKMPEKYTWEIEETEEGGSYVLAVKVTSLETPGQNNEGGEDNPGGETGEDDEEEIIDESTDSHSLRYYANLIGKNVGVAVPVWKLDVSNENLSQVKAAYTDFNAAVAENCFKFESIEPSRNSFQYYNPDRLQSFASKHNMLLRGHTLAWHSQVAEWVSVDGKKNDKNWTRDELLSILKNHILKVVGHFKGKVKQWDVANEVLDDNQTNIRTNPGAYDMRGESVWMRVIGESFVDSAFVWAHQADPSAKLYLNDYDVEFKGKAKSEALFNLAKRLKDAGIPIDGVGLQCHLNVGEVDADKLSAQIARFKAIGLECIITELDIAIKGNKTAAAFEQQAKDFKAITKAMIANDNCTTMMVWGITDDASWRQPDAPLLFDASVKRKQAWYAVRQALRHEANKRAASINAPTTKGSEAHKAVSRDYFTLTGLHLAPTALRSPGLPVIVRTTYSDGTTETKKVY